MTISTTTSRISYTGDGSTLAFAIPFYFQTNADIVVYVNSVLQVLGTDYTLTGATLSAGGTCTFVAAPTSTYLVVIYRDPQMTQTTSYNNNDPFPAKSHELALDKSLTINQRTRDLATRSLRIPDPESSSTVTTLAAAATRANKLLAFDNNGAVTYAVGPTFVGTTSTGVAVVDSKATAQVTTFAVSVNIVRTLGSAAPGDGGGLAYKRGTSGSPTPFQSADGAYWTPATTEISLGVGLAFSGTTIIADPIYNLGRISGLTLSAAGSTATFGVALGVAADATTGAMMSLASAYTKTTSAWAVGSATGALDTGAIANTTWYHVYLIKRVDTGVVDVLISLSATAPTLPTNYTLKRRIGSMRTDGSAQWSKFSQQDDTFLWDADDAGSTPVVNGAPGVTTAVLRAVTIPLGVKVLALLRVTLTGTGGAANCLFTSPDVSDQSSTTSVTAGAASGASATDEITVRSNTSSQVRTRVSTTTCTIYINTAGWIDTRGRS